MSDLGRFIKAQERSYYTALDEIRGGRKESHWMWYIFPQIEGLGSSPTAQYYAISSLEEAEDYLNDPVLGPRLEEISEALMKLSTSDPSAVFGWPDDMKLKSSMTLFSLVAPKGSVFERVLDKYYDGDRDDLTLSIVGRR
jgi:uncharacterized protein (DUF1810 family)